MWSKVNQSEPNEFKWTQVNSSEPKGTQVNQSEAPAKT